MAGLNDAIRNAFPGGVGKPLMLALGALLASGVLTKGGGGQTASAGSQPATDTSDAGGMLGGLGGLLNKLEQGGLGDQGHTAKGLGRRLIFRGLPSARWLATVGLNRATMDDQVRKRKAAELAALKLAGL